ncbi:MAG: isoprenyl transferase [Hyphomicrobiales bacterium]
MDSDATMAGSIPRHVAIIMDGNGRWAHLRSLPRSAGHRQGIEAVRRSVRAAIDFGIEYLTIYSFSTENWSRPTSEITYLMSLLRRFIQQDVAELHANNVKIIVIGEREGLTRDIVSMLEESERLTAGNTGLKLVVAFNYGGRQEIARAAREIAEEVAAGRLKPDQVDADAISSRLHAPGVPDPDLLIRTSGEQRLSNFLLWQLAYAEFVFVDEHWPDFNRDTFARAIAVYQSRERRYGGVTKRALSPA